MPQDTRVVDRIICDEGVEMVFNLVKDSCGSPADEFVEHGLISDELRRNQEAIMMLLVTGMSAG